MTQSFKFTDRGFEKYYYELEIFLHTFCDHDSYHHLEEFHNIDLKVARNTAIESYYQNYKGIEKNGYFLPVASFENFVVGKNSCFSIYLNFVQDINGEVEKFTIFGDKDEQDESLEFEREIFQLLEENF